VVNEVGSFLFTNIKFASPILARSACHGVRNPAFDTDLAIGTKYFEGGKKGCQTERKGHRRGDATSELSRPFLL
jgi:hypothetical protein